jgi:hypothetical protein
MISGDRVLLIDFDHKNVNFNLHLSIGELVDTYLSLVGTNLAGNVGIFPSELAFTIKESGIDCHLDTFVQLKLIFLLHNFVGYLLDVHELVLIDGHLLFGFRRRQTHELRTRLTHTMNKAITISENIAELIELNKIWRIIGYLILI